MKPRTSKVLCRMLEKKGFYKANNDHKYYYLYVDGKITTIKTKVSHGTKPYHIGLMGAIKKQMRFKNPKQLDDYFDCTMDGDGYIKMLRDNKIIPKAKPTK